MLCLKHVLIFASNFDLQFNSSKTKYMYFSNDNKDEHDNIYFMNPPTREYTIVRCACLKRYYQQEYDQYTMIMLELIIIMTLEMCIVKLKQSYYPLIV